MDWTVGCSIMYVFPIVPILSLAYFRIDIVVNWYSLHIYLVVVSDQFDKIKETMILLFCPCILPLRELRWRRAGEYKGSRHRTPGQKREITSLFTSSDNHFDSFWFVQAATFKLICSAGGAVGIEWAVHYSLLFEYNAWGTVGE
jgi:hypothetical protein